MKMIYFIRHAESEANRLDVLASRQDFPLSGKGKLDAAAIATEFKAVASLDHIVCSPLIRAQQTAQPIAEAFGLKIEIDERLTEQELGIYAGMTYAELDQQADYAHDRSTRWRWEAEGGGKGSLLANKLDGNKRR